MEKIYTAFKGKVTESDFVKETPTGFRVRNGKVNYEHIVFSYKERVPHNHDTPLFCTEYSSFDKDEVLNFANRQLVSMELVYKSKLEKVEKAKLELGLLF